VVPDCVVAQVELGGDLLRRAALLQKTKHLDLTGSQMRGRRCGVVVGASLDQPEDADHPFTVPERRRADLHGHPLPGGRDEVAGRLAGQGRAEHLLSESLAGAGPVLGRDEGGEVATANVAEKPLGCGIDPADDSRLVEDVTRDADALQSLLDVAPECQASVHHGSVTRSSPAWNTQAMPPSPPPLAETVREALREVAGPILPELAAEILAEHMGRNGATNGHRRSGLWRGRPHRSGPVVAADACSRRASTRPPRDLPDLPPGGCRRECRAEASCPPGRRGREARPDVRRRTRSGAAPDCAESARARSPSAGAARPSTLG
jgi:hypothetical protein